MMDTSYRQFFALTKEPFGADIPRKDIMVTKALGAMEERIHYTIRMGAIALITGEIGSGNQPPYAMYSAACTRQNTGLSMLLRHQAPFWSCIGKSSMNWQPILPAHPGLP
jgi:hypothetical protein